MGEQDESKDTLSTHLNLTRHRGGERSMRLALYFVVTTSTKSNTTNNNATTKQTK